MSSKKKGGLLGGVMRGLGHVGKKPVRFKYEIYIDRLHGLRNGRYKVRFSRGTKGVETNVKAMDDGGTNSTMVIFEQKTLGMYTTLYRDEKGKSFDIKDFKLTLIEVRNDGGKRTDKVIGATGLNLGDYAGVPSKITDKTCKLGASVTASVRITATFVVGGEERQDDAELSESPLSGMSEDEGEGSEGTGGSGTLSASLPSESGESQDLSLQQPRSASSSQFSGSAAEASNAPRTDSRVEFLIPELTTENERLKRDLEEKELELQKYGALVRSVSSRSMENQLEAEAKLEELQLLNDNLKADLDRTKLEMEKSRSVVAEEGSGLDKEARESLEKAYQGTITGLEATIATLQSEKRSAKSKIKAHENHQERLKSTYKNLSDMYNKLRTDYANLAKKYKSAKVKAVSSQTSTLQAVAHELEREKIRRERDDVMDELNRMRGEQQREIEVAKTQRAETLSELNDLKALIGVLEESETELRKVVIERTQKSRELDTLNVAVAAEVTKVTEEKAAIEESLRQSDARVKELDDSISRTEAQVKELEQALVTSGEKEKQATWDLSVVQETQKTMEREKTEEIKALRNERDKLLNELVVASKKNKELQSSNEDRATLINELETLRRQMDDDKSRHQREHGEMQKLLDDSSAEMKRVSEELETAVLKMELAENSYGAEIKELQKEVDDAAAKISEMAAAHEKELGELTAEKNSALARVATLEKENEDSNATQVAKIERASRELEDVKAKNTKEIETMKSTHAVVLGGIEKEFRDKYSRVCAERDSLQKNLFDLSEQLDSTRTDLELARDAVKNDIQSSKVELETAINEIDQLSKTLTELEEKNENLETDVAKLEASKSELIASLRENELKLDSVRDDFKRKAAEKDSELDERQVQLEGLEADLRNANEQYERNVSEIQEQLQRSAEEHRQAKSRLESQLEFTKREKDEAANELKLVQQQNYEERTQTLSAEVAKAREERDSKAAAVVDLEGAKADLEAHVKSKDAMIQRLNAEKDQQSRGLDDALARNKALIQEMKSEHQAALADEEARRQALSTELRNVTEQLTATERDLRIITEKDYDAQVEALRSQIEEAQKENKSLTTEIDQTKAILTKRMEKVEADKSKAVKESGLLKEKVLATESALAETLSKLERVEESSKSSADAFEAERSALTRSLEESKRELDARQGDAGELSNLKDRAGKAEYELKIMETEKEQLSKTLRDAQGRLSEMESAKGRSDEELKAFKRDSAAEIKRAQAERDDAVILLQKTRTAAKGNDAETGKLKSQIEEYEKKLRQSGADVQRIRDERDKVLKDMDDLQASLGAQTRAADAATDKKGRNTEAQLRAAYARERTLQTRVTALIEENKVLKDGIKKGDSFDSVLNDLVQVKVALAIAEEDKLLLQDELRKYKDDV